MEVMASALFPTLVWTAMFEDHAAFNARLLEATARLREQDPAGVANTNVAGWQSQNNLQVLADFGEFTARIMQIARQIGESQQFASDGEYRLEAWINVNPPGAWNQIHIHPNCHLSGCYYVRTPEHCGGIYFRDPRKMSLMTRPPITQENRFTATEARMRPEAGRFYIFPAWLEHGVEPNRGDSERVSIAFNVQVQPAGRDPMRA
jgi:uncharacterized protein (TIGR02466 family)